MILYPMNEMLTQVKSRYELVNLVARRARQITSENQRHESDELWEAPADKPVTIALNEALAGELPLEEPSAPRDEA